MYIFITHRIIMIKLEVSTFPIVVIFCRGWGAWGCKIMCRQFPMYHGKAVFSFIIVQFSCVQITKHIMPDRCIRFFALNITSLSLLCRRSWRYWTSKKKKLNKYIWSSCVPKIMSILLIIFCVIYGALCIQLARYCYDDCENMCILS